MKSYLNNFFFLIECSVVRMLLFCWLSLVLFRLFYCCSWCFRFLAFAFLPYCALRLLSRACRL
jgi:hypothetical protein